MIKNNRFFRYFFILLSLMLLLSGCGANVKDNIEIIDENTKRSDVVYVEEDSKKEGSVYNAEDKKLYKNITEDGYYTSKEDVSRYIYMFNKLPDNYITKKEAKKLGWKQEDGNLQDVAPDMSIGGDRFGNHEEKLPQEEGKKYFECDIDYQGGFRGTKRIVYSNDGDIYYTDDHYETFELLYEADK